MSQAIVRKTNRKTTGKSKAALVKPLDLPKLKVTSVPYAGTNVSASSGCDTCCA